MGLPTRVLQAGPAKTMITQSNAFTDVLDMGTARFDRHGSRTSKSKIRPRSSTTSTSLLGLVCQDHPKYCETPRELNSERTTSTNRKIIIQESKRRTSFFASFFLIELTILDRPSLTRPSVTVGRVGRPHISQIMVYDLIHS